ncbi:glycosyltransferase family protein [Calothrix sp. UHCC 0171]|uniref:glycosyltransferase family protein n=1 Tax=Calothrix sp. UHCC 0171 TaxID=3110245 RepID=UPI002B2004FA|nr:glycosyltransferase [Calothrix sp. UHCC 0171]MEA5573063.1 glycosyltransferase [Calothrix sp. UHCC 0171]
MRLMVYSHDTFGLGNIRRMLVICEHLLKEIPGLSILLLSGSPMLQGFRLPKGIDYIKLPCLNRGETGEVTAKYLGINIEDTIRLRSHIILSAAIHFQPDLFLVDKKAYGIKNELVRTVRYLHKNLPKTKLVLLFRDILDTPEKTIHEWKKNSYYEALEKYYHLILVVGTPDIFDFSQEYQLPQKITDKVRFCGYLRRPSGQKNKRIIRQELQIELDEKLILVTPGGGEDGYQLINNYLQGLKILPKSEKIKSVIICGPEMPIADKQALEQAAKSNYQVQMGEFTDDLMSYIEAADAVVSMGGYNTICEILSAGKPAVIVPRFQPSQEQLIRSLRMQQKTSFQTIHPHNLTPKNLISQLTYILAKPHTTHNIDLDGLSRITRQIRNLLADIVMSNKSQLLYYQSNNCCSLKTVLTPE